MRVTVVGSIVLCLAAAPYALASCSEDTPSPIGPATAPTGEAGAGDGGAVGSLDTPSLPCADSADSVYGDPGPLSADPSARGNILKCAKEPDLSKDAMQAKLTANGYAGPPLKSNARVYKIAFRTERGDTAGTPAVSSAIVFVPETPRAAKLPVIVASRGARGQAARCTLSKFDPSLESINNDAYNMIYPLVGSGYAVIIPDLAGYANFGAANNPPSAFAQAADMGRGTLDGSRALKKLFPALDDKLVLVGHSQGGHTTLAALSMIETYGAAAPVVGAAVYAPLWLSQRSWGALMYRTTGAGKDYPLATVPAAGNVSVWYHYTQGELLDGPGKGKEIFAAAKQAAIEDFVKTECWDSPKLATLGTYIDELYDTTFVTELAFPAATGAPCDAPFCQKWVDRYSADRPHLTGKAATTPILFAYGMQDTTLVPARMKCALDRLKVDNAAVTYCLENDKDHNSIVAARSGYVGDWIASVALGATAPAACATNESVLTAACPAIPPND